MNMDDPPVNPMRHPEEQPAGVEDAPRFGRLLMVLLAVVLGLAALAFAAEAVFS